MAREASQSVDRSTGRGTGRCIGRGRCSQRVGRRLRFEPLEERQLLAVLSVNSLADNTTAGDGLVTLREAVAAANADLTTDLGDTGSGSDTIEFAAGLSGSVDLLIATGSSALAVSTPITIRGNATGITIARSAAATEMRLFEVMPNGSLTLDSLTLSGGIARGASAMPDGGEGQGGAFLNQGTLEIRRSTLVGNTALGGDGMGGAGGPGRGGAIYNDGGTVLLVNATLSGNMAQSGAGPSSPPSRGGAVYSRNGTLSIYNSTLTENTSDAARNVFALGDGAGATATLVIDSSIIWQSEPLFVAELVVLADNGGTAVSSGQNNLIRMAVGFSGEFDMMSDPLLGPLEQNGGPVRTHALPMGSPAIDQGANPLQLITDGRGAGFARVVGGRADVGAFELQSAAPSLLGDYNRSGVVDAADYVLWRKTFDMEVEEFAGADGSGNGRIDSADYGVWWENFGATESGAAVSSETDRALTPPRSDSSAAEMKFMAGATTRVDDTRSRRLPPRASGASAIAFNSRLLDVLAQDIAKPELGSPQVAASRDPGRVHHDGYSVSQFLEHIWCAWPEAPDLL